MRVRKEKGEMMFITAAMFRACFETKKDGQDNVVATRAFVAEFPRRS